MAKFDPFSYPEIDKLFGELFSLFNESGSGALLIATAHVDDFLKDLIDSFITKKLGKKHRERLYGYNGHLGTFSSRIELAYAFRLINKRLYDSMNALRRMRNEAAHSSEKIELHELSEKLSAVFDLGPGFAHFIRETSTQSMFQFKIEELKKIISESNLTEEDQKKMLKEIINRQDSIDSMVRQVPFWELLYGLCFLCALLVDNKNKIMELTDGVDTLTDLKNKRS